MYLVRALGYIERIMLFVQDLPNTFQKNVEIPKGPLKLIILNTEIAHCKVKGPFDRMSISYFSSFDLKIARLGPLASMAALLNLPTAALAGRGKIQSSAGREGIPLPA